MKIVINTCYGGFGLSPLAIQRIAELQGRKCFFFQFATSAPARVFDKYEPISLEQASKAFSFTAFDIPNPNDFVGDTAGWSTWSKAKKGAHNKAYEDHVLGNRYDDETRSDPRLVQVVEELGAKANGSCAKLKVVEIPDGTSYSISEYDGMESIEEAHRSWG